MNYLRMKLKYSRITERFNLPYFFKLNTTVILNDFEIARKRGFSKL